MRTDFRPLLSVPLIALFVSLAGCEEEVDPASLPSTDRPSDAIVLDSAVKPESLVFEVKNDPAMRASYIGTWLADRGWQGEVLKVRHEGGMAIFSLRADDSTVPGDIVIYCEAPGDDTVKAPGLARITGRVKDVEISDRIDIKPHRVLVDRVSVVRFQGG